MKKTLLVSVLVVILICTAMTGFATPVGEPELTVKDAVNNIVNVSGKTDKNEMVVLIVLNPGKTEADINPADSAATAAAVQYMDSMWVSNSEYDFDIPMNGTEGGEYTVIITAGDKKLAEPLPFEFHFNVEKEQIIKKINSPGASKLEDLIDEAYTLYSLATNKLYTQGDIKEITKVIEDFKGSGFSSDVRKFDVTLKNAALIGAFNAGKDGVLVDETLQYTGEGYLDVEDTEEYEDYLNALSDEGLEEVHNSLILDGAEYETIEDIQEAFCEFVVLNCIINNNQGGYGHVDTYFDKYSDLIKKYGFNTGDLKKLNKSSVYLSMIQDTKAKNLKELAKEFNKLVEESNESSNGGSGSSSSSTGGYKPSPVTPSTNTNYAVAASFFVDIDSVEWAKDEILVLADKGIVNGVGNNNFAPNASVTRAEFLKMLMAALELTTDGSEMPFKDVTAKWAVPYVAAAVKYNITNGISEAEFAPNAYVTREQSATFVTKALRAKGIELTADTNVFDDDADVSDWAKDGVNSLKKAGVVSGGGDGKFNPKNNLTRAEAAQMIFNVMNVK